MQVFVIINKKNGGQSRVSNAFPIDEDIQQAIPVFEIIALYLTS